MASNSEFNNDSSQNVTEQLQTNAQDICEVDEALPANTDVVGSQLVIEDLHEQMMSLEEQIAAKQGDVDTAQVQLAALEQNLATHLNGLEPGTSDGVEVMEEGIVDTLAEATEDDGEESGEQVASADNVASELAGIEPAAGEGAIDGTAAGGAGGYGFQSSFDSEAVGAIDDVGPIDPTLLEYNVRTPEEDIIIEDEEVDQAASLVDDNPIIAEPEAVDLDETNLDLGHDGVVEVDFGNDGPGTIGVTGDVDVSGSLTGGVLSSGGVEVEISNTDTGYQGTANGQTVFTLSIDPTTGEYSYTQVLPFDHADGSDANDVINLSFGIEATDADGDRVETTITINVADDAPMAPDPVESSLDETDIGPATSVSGSLDVNFGNDGPGSVSSNGDFESSGSRTGDVLSSGGVPVEVSNTPDGYIGTANGQTVFTMTLDPLTGDYVYTQVLPFDHADGNDTNDVITLEFGVTVTDSDTDSASTTITINVADDAPLIAPPLVNTVDETDLGPTAAVSGQVDVDFGNDAAGSIIANGTSIVGDLTSGGVPVSVIFNPDGNSYTGIANGEVIFTMTVQNDGSYEFVLSGTLDHPDTSDPNDVLPLQFGVKAIDGDGDSVDTTITINVADDAPLIAPPLVNNVDETDLGPNTSVSGKVDVNFGNDGAGSVSSNGQSTIGDLTSNGQPVSVVFDPDTGAYTGVAGGQVVFTLTVQDNGAYDFVLSGTLDHPDTGDHNDVLPLQFGVKATDGDGDSVDTVITINVADDGPIAMDDVNGFDAGQRHTDGNVITGENGGQNAADDLSQDLDNTVTEIKFGNTVVQVPEADTSTIDGEFGTLEIAADGSYTYTLFDGVDVFGNAGGRSAFNPTQADTAGVSDSITKDGITISVEGDGDYDISWLDTGTHGAGLGIDNLNSNDSVKVWPKGETFNIDPVNDADSLTITIAELGSNNAGGQHGLDYVVTLADGTTVAGEVQFAPGEINNGLFEFTLNAADFGGQLINSIDINSINDGEYQGASFLLNNVEATYPGTDVDVQDQFTYTITDGDGDSSTATLTLDGIEPTLIVGENVSDDGTSTTPHHIGDEGVIEGTAAGDLLVGDVGGSDLQAQTQDYNFLFVIDVSGSMGDPNNPASKISLLTDAIDNLLGDVGQYQNGDIKVHFTPFSTVSDGGASFTITDPNGLSGAMNYLDALSTGGFTNYEAALQNGISWLESGQAIDGAETVTYFISDGQPNRFVTDTNESARGNPSEIIDELSGSDGTDEISTLNSLSSEVIAVGIGVNDDTIVTLNAIDSDGQAIPLSDPNNLNATLAETNPLLKLAPLGDDVIKGGDGDDIIFGDSLNTDDLADDHGLDTPDGVGFEVIDQLEAGQSVLKAAWDRADTIRFIEQNADDLAEETTDSAGDGREGGDDILDGGAGDDVIYGQEGDDVIYGGAGNDTLIGGSGADSFAFDGNSGGIDVIRDFSTDEGDVLDLSGLISNYDPAQQAIDNFVFSRDVDGGTILSVDVTGSGDASNAVDLVALEGMQNVDLQSLVETGNIHVV